MLVNWLYPKKKNERLTSFPQDVVLYLGARYPLVRLLPSHRIGTLGALSSLTAFQKDSFDLLQQRDRKQNQEREKTHGAKSED